MPVYNFDFNRSVTNLDLSAGRSGIFTPGIERLELREDDLARFNVLVRELAPDHRGFSADQIAGAARRVLRAAQKGHESSFIKVRLRRLGEIRAALADPGWQVAPAFAGPMRAIVDYLDDSAGALIPNDLPVVGLLDDAVLVDVAMDRLRGELDDYAEFCRYRIAESARLGVDPRALSVRREQWQLDRQEELRLEQQLRRVRSSNYGRSSGAGAGFRIC